ncbi:Possible ABC transport system periplasmic substrate-binding protein [hydrothermal vent metagenome]|uniref:Possible ABC transport system periplasmic substrate-binding protein n=1 Tax=hydrothermal vent metagenome TaxID=652676 RepID=A0A1W1CN53_9ZZZZ
MYSKVNYMIVGLFVLLFGVGLLLFGFWLAKYGLKESYATYKIEIQDSVSGLSKDSSVKLHGVDIGYVSHIDIDPENIEIIRIFVKIKKEVPIKEDMVASTQMLGVTGLLSIEIDGGTNESKILQPTDSYIPLIKSKSSIFSKVTQNIEGLSERLIHLLTRSETLLSDRNLDNIDKILKNVARISAKGEAVEVKAIESMHEVDTTLQTLRTSINTINTKFTEATDDFKLMQKDFAAIKDVTIPTVNKLFQTTKDFRRVTLKFEKSLDRGDYNLKKMIEPMLVDIQILSNQLNDTTKSLGESPSDLFFKARKVRRGPGE